MGMVKIDLLGLGMMAVMKDCLELDTAALWRGGGPGAASGG